MSASQHYGRFGSFTPPYPYSRTAPERGKARRNLDPTILPSSAESTDNSEATERKASQDPKIRTTFFSGLC